MLEGFKHFRQHGDLAYVQRLIVDIPDTRTRHEFAIELCRQSPINIRKDGTLSLNKERAETFDWTVINSVKIWPRRLVMSDDCHSIGNQTFSTTEFIYEVIDALVLHRNAVDPSGLKDCGKRLIKVWTGDGKPSNRTRQLERAMSEQLRESRHQASRDLPD